MAAEGSRLFWFWVLVSQTATSRLNDQLGSVYGYADKHFGGQNLYLDEIDKNIHYASEVATHRDLSLLRREPPKPGEEETQPLETH